MKTARTDAILAKIHTNSAALLAKMRDGVVNQKDRAMASIYASVLEKRRNASH